jgi:hypothetical protein
MAGLFSTGGASVPPFRITCAFLSGKFATCFCCTSTRHHVFSQSCLPPASFYPHFSSNFFRKTYTLQTNNSVLHRNIHVFYAALCQSRNSKLISDMTSLPLSGNKPPSSACNPLSRCNNAS